MGLRYNGIRMSCRVRLLQIFAGDSLAIRFLKPWESPEQPVHLNFALRAPIQKEKRYSLRLSMVDCADRQLRNFST